MFWGEGGGEWRGVGRGEEEILNRGQFNIGSTNVLSDIYLLCSCQGFLSHIVDVLSFLAL